MYPDSNVFALALSPAGDVLSVGGWFRNIGGRQRLSLAEFDLWQLWTVVAHIGPGGGALILPHDHITYTFPAGAFTETISIAHTPYRPWRLPSTAPLASSRHAFDVTAVYSDTGQPAQLAPGQHFTITIDPLDKGTLIPGTLALWWWDEDDTTWSQTGITTTVSADGGQLTAQVSHLSLFAVLGETRRVYLPLVLRNAR